MAAPMMKSSAISYNNMTSKTLPASVNFTIHHDQQSSNWDCGLSCVKMVLSIEKRKEFVENWEKILKDEDLDTSVWSIDLAYLLRRFGVPHHYYTKTIGVDPSYAHEAYYRNVFNADHNRVISKFENASNAGVQVEKRQLTLEEILQLVTTISPAIVLINNNYIQCSAHYAHKIQYKFSNIFSRWSPHQFADKRIIFYHNPTYSQGVCAMDFNTFECARKFNGTDEDIIFIELSQNSYPFALLLE